jgi:hypothetical protein
MGKLKFINRVDFTYILGAGISLVSFNLAMFLYKESGLPMIFSLVCLLTYTGVIIRGIIDRPSWGKTQKQMKISAFVGFTSLFIIFSIQSFMLLTYSSTLTTEEIRSSSIYGAIGIILLYILLYILWFRKLSFQDLEDK